MCHAPLITRFHATTTMCNPRVAAAQAWPRPAVLAQGDLLHKLRLSQLPGRLAPGALLLGALAAGRHIGKRGGSGNGWRHPSASPWCPNTPCKHAHSRHSPAMCMVVCTYLAGKPTSCSGSGGWAAGGMLVAAGTQLDSTQHSQRSPLAAPVPACASPPCLRSSSSPQPPAAPRAGQTQLAGRSTRRVACHGSAGGLGGRARTQRLPPASALQPRETNPGQVWSGLVRCGQRGGPTSVRFLARSVRGSIPLMCVSVSMLEATPPPDPSCLCCRGGRAGGGHLEAARWAWKPCVASSLGRHGQGPQPPNN